MISWSLVGDIAHIGSLTSSLSFVIAAIYYRSIFDPLWKEQGFCVSNIDVNYWTSHDMCLYADLILGTILGIVYWKFRNQPRMSKANDFLFPLILGTIFHGIAHGGLAASLRKDNNAVNGLNSIPEEDDTAAQSSFSKFVFQGIPFFLFWTFVLRAAMPQVPFFPGIPIMTVFAMIGNRTIPKNFGFTFVHTVLTIASVVSELNKPKDQKGFEYGIYPLIVGIPVGIVGWIESTQCSNFVIDWGGHLLYDVYIPFSILVFYTVCWVRAEINVGKKSEKVKLA